MAARIIDGEAIAKSIRAEIAVAVEDLAVNGMRPGVATLLVGEDGGARFYRRQLERATEAVGFAYFSHVLPAQASEAEVLGRVAELNRDDRVHGILTLMPMPARIDKARLFSAISAIKDIDCVNPANVGHVLLGDQLFAPATPSACIEILDRIGVDLQGLDVTIVNRSVIVGKPLGLLCLSRNASVRFVHTFSKDVAAACREADVLVSGAPVQGLIGRDMVKRGAIVLDVTTIFSNGKQVGSVDFEGVREVASYVTPVPGGIGPVTTAVLLKQGLIACKAQCEAV